jgi:hypothetical protein
VEFGVGLLCFETQKQQQQLVRFLCCHLFLCCEFSPIVSWFVL